MRSEALKDLVKNCAVRVWHEAGSACALSRDARNRSDFAQMEFLRNPGSEAAQDELIEKTRVALDASEKAKLMSEADLLMRPVLDKMYEVLLVGQPRQEEEE